MHMAYRVAGNPFYEDLAPEALRRFGRSATLAGVTTATDLHSRLDDGTVSTYRAVTAEDDFPLRLVPAYAGISGTSTDGIALLERTRPYSTDKLHLGLVKLMTDGSIQGSPAGCGGRDTSTARRTGSGTGSRTSWSVRSKTSMPPVATSTFTPMATRRSSS